MASDGQPSATFIHTLPMKVRVRKVPPTEYIEAFDVPSYQFRAGEVYEVGVLLGAVLIAWEYAEPEMRRDDRGEAATTTPVAPPETRQKHHATSSAKQTDRI